MRRTVRQVAKASGVSVRALHHYDEIGLLKPAEIGRNGYRYYGRNEMLRLQQILFFRELGLPLEEIRRTLDDPGFDRRAALGGHRIRLEAEAARLRRLIRTIDLTIETMEKETAMEDRDMFAGFSPEKQAQWERDIEQRFGDCGKAAVARSKAAMSNWTPAGMMAFKAEIDALHEAFAALIDQGAEPDSAEAQSLTARHYRWVCRSWTPDAAAYVGLGRRYVEHEDFRTMYEAIQPGLAGYLAAAMAIYAERVL